jgi:ParB family chromosome partitioning protein
VGGGLSVREAEALSQKGGDKKPSAKSAASARDADTVALEKRIADALGMAVSLEHKAQGGRLEIKYRTLEQLDLLSLKLTGYGG